MKLPTWMKRGQSKLEVLQGQVKALENEFGINMLAKKYAGETVTVDSSMGLDIVYSCIRDKSESIGQLPAIVKRNGAAITRGKREHRILTQRPNEFQTMQDFVEMFVTTMETTGNFYALPVYNKYGSLAEIIPFFHQRGVRPSTDLNGRIYYTYSTNDGKPAVVFSGKHLMHIKLNSLNGYEGLSPISSAARTIGVAISQEVYLDSLMADGAMSKGILTTDQVFSDENATKRVKTQWAQSTGGARKAGGTPVLEYGLKYQPIGISPADSELIKQRVFSRIQICAIHRVPPSRVGVVEAQKFKNTEENNKSYLRDSLIPLITKLESAMNFILPDDLLWVLDTSKFARGDRKSMAEALALELKSGAISIGEFREGMDRDRVEGDDVHAIDTNNLTFGLLTDIPKLQEQARLDAQAATTKPDDTDNPDEESTDE